MTPDKISNVPRKPGVYLFKGQRERVLYVGKAKNLRSRLASYFRSPSSLDQRKLSMVKLVKDFSCLVTENELEALILEANLIKQHKPPFNVVLRDDKNYPYLKLTVAEAWPRLEVVRRIAKDGSIYFGPYVPAQIMWDALSFIRKNFNIRTCRHRFDRPMRPCIQYQMKRCDAPCAGLVTRDDYMKTVDEIRLFLKGERGELLKNLEKSMHRLSGEQNFEEAAKVRDRIANLQRLWESQRVIAPELGDLDALGFYTNGTDAACDVFFIRNGVLVGTKDFFLKGVGGLPRGELVHSFIEMFYAKDIIPPSEIIVPAPPDNLATLKRWLKKKRGGAVRITVPRDDKRLGVLAMADENAAQVFMNRTSAGLDETLHDLKERLGLASVPHTIGAFDVSTTSGTESTGAFVYWRNGEFIKELYRHLRIKEVPGIDDYGMMREVVGRTLKSLGEDLPDLIIIDGGKGQLDVARDALDKNAPGRQGAGPVLIGLAKDPDRAITPSDLSISLEDRHRSSLLLKRIRDEVHRFAVQYHKNLRGKRFMKSPLEGIRGIGKRRRLELLRHFGSIQGIRNASLEEIADLKGMNRKIAETILNELRRP